MSGDAIGPKQNKSGVMETRPTKTTEKWVHAHQKASENHYRLSIMAMKGFKIQNTFQLIKNLNCFQN